MREEFWTLLNWPMHGNSWPSYFPWMSQAFSCFLWQKIDDAWSKHVPEFPSNNWRFTSFDTRTSVVFTVMAQNIDILVMQNDFLTISGTGKPRSSEDFTKRLGAGVSVGLLGPAKRNDRLITPRMMASPSKPSEKWSLSGDTQRSGKRKFFLMVLN